MKKNASWKSVAKNLVTCRLCSAFKLIVFQIACALSSLSIAPQRLPASSSEAEEGGVGESPSRPGTDTLPLKMFRLLSCLLLL